MSDDFRGAGGYLSAGCTELLWIFAVEHAFLCSLLVFRVIDNGIHRVPKLATPLASNTLNSVWSSWISTKYHTLHYLNINYCNYTPYRVCSMWRHYDVRVCKLYGMNLTIVLLTRRSNSGAPPKSLRRGQRWSLWAQTLKTSSEWSSPWMFHIL